MSYTARDVIVYLTDYPWKFLVKNHNGVVARIAVTDYSKATNYRNILQGGDSAVIGPTGKDTTLFVPPTTPFPGTPADNTSYLLLSDPTAEIAGVAGAGPRPEAFTRVIRYFCTVDAPTPPDPPSVPGTPYQCWDDEYRGLGDVDANNELDE